MSRRPIGDVAAARRYAEALAAFPRRRAPRLHFIRGWKAELGEAEANAALVGSDAEQLGAARAREIDGRDRQLVELRARAPLQSKGRAVEDAGHLPLFVAANEPTLF